jgi:hypothetical protein
LARTYTSGDVDTEQRDFDDLPSGIFKLEVTESRRRADEERRRHAVSSTHPTIMLSRPQVNGRKFFG